MKFEVVKCTVVFYWEEVCSSTDTAYQKISENKVVHWNDNKQFL